MAMDLQTCLNATWLVLIACAWLSTISAPLARLSCYGKLWSADAPFASFSVDNGLGFSAFYVTATLLNGSFIVLYTLKYSYDDLNFVFPEPLQHRSSSRTDCDATMIPLLVAVLLQMQLLRRTAECFHVHKFSAKRQHVAVFLMGLVYYVLTVMASFVDAPPIDFRCVTTTEIRRMALTPRLVFLVGVFVVGWVTQAISHAILASLRPVNGTDSSYRIPAGFLFSYVTMPHYFAEIVMYLSLALLRRDSTTQWLVFLWVFSNLCITAHRSHEWYLKKFENYRDLGRARVIPFIY